MHLASQAQRVSILEAKRYHFGGYWAQVYIARYDRLLYHPRLVSFESETLLREWCLDNGSLDAISGGFFDRANRRALGEIWQAGRPLPHTGFAEPWRSSRGALLIDKQGQLDIAPRFVLPPRPQNHLLQAGPTLVYRGKNLIRDNSDCEGFSSGSGQFDSDIAAGQNPRGAIGFSRDHIFTVAVDGYNPDSWGIRLDDLADIFIGLGASHALNLDGGGSVSLIHGGELVNSPRSRGYKYPMCRPTHSAIILEAKNGS
jgi:exopolysaccharide biosynthesis protein